jgi:hypothetical protein
MSSHPFLIPVCPLSLPPSFARYYYNAITGTVSWTKPDSFLEEEGGPSKDPVRRRHSSSTIPVRGVTEEGDDDDAALGAWKETQDANGKVYYYNSDSGAVAWTRPKSKKKSKSKRPLQEPVPEDAGAAATTDTDADTNTDTTAAARKRTPSLTAAMSVGSGMDSIEASSAAAAAAASNAGGDATTASLPLSSSMTSLSGDDESGLAPLPPPPKKEKKKKRSKEKKDPAQTPPHDAGVIQRVQSEQNLSTGRPDTPDGDPSNAPFSGGGSLRSDRTFVVPRKKRDKDGKLPSKGKGKKDGAAATATTEGPAPVLPPPPPTEKKNSNKALMNRVAEYLDQDVEAVQLFKQQCRRYASGEGNMPASDFVLYLTRTFGKENGLAIAKTLISQLQAKHADKGSALLAAITAKKTDPFVLRVQEMLRAKQDESQEKGGKAVNVSKAIKKFKMECKRFVDPGVTYTAEEFFATLSGMLGRTAALGLLPELTEKMPSSYLAVTAKKNGLLQLREEQLKKNTDQSKSAIATVSEILGNDRKSLHEFKTRCIRFGDGTEPAWMFWNYLEKTFGEAKAMDLLPRLSELIRDKKMVESLVRASKGEVDDPAPEDAVAAVLLTTPTAATATAATATPVGLDDHPLAFGEAKAIDHPLAFPAPAPAAEKAATGDLAEAETEAALTGAAVPPVAEAAAATAGVATDDLALPTDDPAPVPAPAAVTTDVTAAAQQAAATSEAVVPPLPAEEGPAGGAATTTTTTTTTAAAPSPIFTEAAVSTAAATATTTTATTTNAATSDGNATLATAMDAAGSATAGAGEKVAAVAVEVEGAAGVAAGPATAYSKLEDKYRRKFRAIANEIFQTEKGYVKDIDVLVNQFEKPLVDHMDTSYRDQDIDLAPPPPPATPESVPPPPPPEDGSVPPPPPEESRLKAKPQGAMLFSDISSKVMNHANLGRPIIPSERRRLPRFLRFSAHMEVPALPEVTILALFSNVREVVLVNRALLHELLNIQNWLQQMMDFEKTGGTAFTGKPLCVRDVVRVTVDISNHSLQLPLTTFWDGYVVFGQTNDCDSQIRSHIQKGDRLVCVGSHYVLRKSFGDVQDVIRKLPAHSQVELLVWRDREIPFPEDLPTNLANGFAEHCVAMAVSNCFDRMMPYFAVYTPYCSNFYPAMELLAAVRESMESFGEWEDEMKKVPQCQGLELGSFLIKPIQRICKYPLFFRELLSCFKLESGHTHTNGELEVGLKAIQDINTEVNRRVGEAEDRKKLQKIVEELQGTCPKLLTVNPNRMLLQHSKQVVYAELQMSLDTNTGIAALKLGPRKDCVLILCSDVLVVAEPDLFGNSLSHIHTFEIEFISMHDAPPEACAGGKLGDENVDTSNESAVAYLISDSVHSFTCWFDNKEGAKKMADVVTNLQKDEDDV